VIGVETGESVDTWINTTLVSLGCPEISLPEISTEVFPEVLEVSITLSRKMQQPAIPGVS